MNDFEIKLTLFADKFKEIQADEEKLQMKVQVTTGEFQGFLREHGLPEKFTMAEMIQLGIRKSRA